MPRVAPVIAAAVLVMAALFAPASGLEEAQGPDLRSEAVDLSHVMGGHFLANKGQIPYDDVVFHTQNAYLTTTGLTLRLLGAEDDGRPVTSIDAPPSGQRMHVLTMEFIGTDGVVPVGRGALPHATNFFLGDDPGSWASDVPSFSEVVYEDLYDGVDLVFRQVPEGLKYEFLVGPGASVEDIGLRFHGAALRATGADLIIETPLGAIRDGPLVAYQVVDGGTVPVHARLDLGGDTVRYIVDHDPALPLVIDPLIYSTYLGHDARDIGLSITTDTDGHAYVTGQTASFRFPATNGTFDMVYNGGTDAFVTKMNKAGSRLLFSTFIGGGSYDNGWSIRIDDMRRIYLAGDTQSNNFPTTIGSFSQTKAAGSDAFVLRLSSDGDMLEYSTFLGGDINDHAISMAVDLSYRTYVLGVTNSTDLPTTAGAYMTAPGGQRDLFIARLDPAGAALGYLTYLGGSGMEIDPGYVGEMLDVDAQGNAVVAGYTYSSDFPVTPGAVNHSNDDTETDIFVTKLGADGKSLVYSALISGNHSDLAVAVAVDGTGAAFVTGFTNSTDLPTAPGTYRPNNMGGYDGFVIKVSADGAQLEYVTYFGGSATDWCNAIALDSAGNAYLTGITNSGDFPVSSGAFSIHKSGNHDVFLSALNDTGTRMLYSTFIGDTMDEFGKRLAVDRWDNAYVTGYTQSMNFPTTEEAFDQEFGGGGEDAFVLKLSNMVNPLTFPEEPLALAAVPGNGHVRLSWSPPSSDGGLPLLNYTVYRGYGPDPAKLVPLTVLGNVTAFNDTSVTNGMTYHYAITATNELDEGPMSAVVNATPGGVPSEPLGLAASPGNGYIGINWSQPTDDNGSPVTGYAVHRGPTVSDLVPLVILPVVTELNDTNVTNGATYHYAVAAINDWGEGPLSEVINSTPWSLPSAPIALDAEPGPGHVLLTWLPPDDDGGFPVTSYTVHRGPASDDISVYLSEPSTTFNDTNVTNGLTYHYAVTAHNKWGDGPLGNLARATPSDVPDPPVLAARSNRTVILNWTLPNSNGLAVIHYNLYRGPDQDNLTYLDETTAIGYEDSNVTRHETYYYAVAAVNPVGEGPLSNVVKAIPGGVGPYRPDAPEWVLTIPGDRYVYLSWAVTEKRFTPAPTMYRLFRSAPSTGNLTLLVEVEVPNYNDTGLTNGQTYQYMVSAVNSVGEGNLSGTVEATPSSKPGLPRALDLKPGKRQVELTWSQGDTGGRPIIEYRIYRKGVSGDNWTFLAQTRALSYTDKGLDTGRTYFYMVAAVNDNGEGPGAWDKARTITPTTTTGVESSTALYIVLAVLAVLIVIILVLNMLRHRHEKERDRDPEEDEGSDAGSDERGEDGPEAGTEEPGPQDDDDVDDRDQEND